MGHPMQGRTTSHTVTLCIVALMLPVLAGFGDVTAQGPGSAVAQQLLNTAGTNGGLIVHLGCGDGRLTAALRSGESCLVHGLDTDAGKIEQAREYIRQQGIYGPVSVEVFDGERLPYADNTVNLLVAEELGAVPADEAMRVLCPGGVLCVKQGDGWRKTEKPRPDAIDEWTHYLHDPGGNPVAHDDLVGPPRRLQWSAGPPHGRSHEHTPSINAVVSSGGRIFYISDEGPISSVSALPKWTLVARDAFNGLLLWKRPIETWYPHLINWGVAPRPLQRRLVAIGDKVWVTFGYYAPVSMVDAATGDTLKVYEGTEGTEEIVCHNGVLLLSVRSVTEERVAESNNWAQLVQQKDSPVYDRDSADPLVKQFTQAESKAQMSILALDAGTGSVLWKKDGPDGRGLQTLTLCAEGDRAYYHYGQGIICRDLKTGAEIWTAPHAPMRFIYDGRIMCVSKDVVKALSAETGETLWEQKPLLTSIRDLFVAGGSAWVGGFKPIENKRGPEWGPYFATQRDLNTGEVIRHLEPENPGHHHRCYMNKATDRYILGGRRGTEFIDLQSGEVLWNSWARGVCKYGVMPCNGLLYAPSHACGCYMAAKLEGFSALATADPKAMAALRPVPALERGPAYDAPATTGAASADWPTYRRDVERTGCTAATVPTALRVTWKSQVGNTLTSPTVADGKVFVASPDSHQVCAIDADSGKPAWRFTAGARVDSPPTLHQGRALFGCRDGHAYSVRASDGELAWRLRIIPEDRRTVVREQLESVWPAHGSVLVDDGVAYFTAGRSSYLDGGINLCRVDPRAGKVLSATQIYSPDRETGKQPEHTAPAFMPGARSDILSADEGHVYLREMVFDKQGAIQPEGDTHLFTLTDFLDDSWPHRSYWILGTELSVATGCSGRSKTTVYGRLLSFDDATVYGYGRSNVHWSNALQDGAYRIFAMNRESGARKWEVPVPIHVRAMVLAGDVLFLAGPKAAEDEGRWQGDENREGTLLAVSAADGSVIAQYPLDACPVLDGIAAAGGRLYISLTDGSVVCMSGG